MSRTVEPRPAGGTAQSENPWAEGLVLFAGVIMITAGVYHALAGVAAIVRDEVYVSTPNYVFEFDLTAWGWIHLLLGLLVAVAGFSVMTGQAWARAVGITLVALSLIANFLFIPYYPIWSLVIIALDVAIIWALAGYRRVAV